MNNNTQISVKNSPLRGEVNLQSSPGISLFLITFLLLSDIECSLKGDFLGNIVEEYCKRLQSHGFAVSCSEDRVFVDKDYSIEDISFLTLESTIDIYTLILALSKRGKVQAKQNSDFVGIFNYLGYKVEQEKIDSFTLYNKVVQEKTSLTFQETNEDYFYVCLLLFYLTHKKFTISIPETTYEISLLTESLKEYGLVEEQNFENYITFSFDFTNLDLLKKQDTINVPKDPIEFIFFAFCALNTHGEIRINGLNSKYLASTLRVIADMGGGFDALSESSVKVWGGNFSFTNLPTLVQESYHFEFSKLCMLITLGFNKEDLDLNFKLNQEKYTSLFKDVNRLGGSILFNESGLGKINEFKQSSGKLYFEKNQEFQNYLRLLFGISGEKTITYSNLQNLKDYNFKVFDKLQSLGLQLNYDYSE